MTALCFDISSGGVSVATFNSRFEIEARAEERWHFQTHASGAATLSTDLLVARVKSVLRGLKTPLLPEAIGIGCFMHSCMLLDLRDQPVGPVFTWLDQRGQEGVAYVRNRLGDRFHEITGCRYHPMFPIFKAASLHLRNAALLATVRRVVSVKAWLIRRLTGVWVEDHGTASSSGLFNLKTGNWDDALLEMVGLRRDSVVPLACRTDVVGQVTSEAAMEFGLPEGTPVICGSGDGLLANVGSECETPSRISVTLGTSAAARQVLPTAVLNTSSGTFCYKGDENQFFLGCAGNNGGNALDWGRSIFGSVDVTEAEDVPIFIPLLRGERSPEWAPALSASFRDLRAHHTAPHLGQAVLEGVIFNLQWFVEILQETSGEQSSELVLSGNGFLEDAAPQILASTSNVPVLMPGDPGAASLRGAAVCVFRALGRPIPPLDLRPVPAVGDTRLLARYLRYKELRNPLYLDALIPPSP
jgi:gluconokinase